MVKIIDFDNVLEIAFGLNALFFLFELVPHTKERLRRLADQYEKAYKEKVEATRSTEAFPIGFFISATYPYKKRIMEVVTVIMSLILLGIMIYAGFIPNATLSSRKMFVLLFFSFGIPCAAIRVCKGPVRVLKAAIERLEQQTRMAQLAQPRANTKK